MSIAANSAPADAGPRWQPRQRWWLSVIALLLAVACLIPPVSTFATRYVFVGAIQYCFFATVIPALVVLSAPWHLLRLAGGEGDGPAALGPADRLAASRATDTPFLRSAAFLGIFVVVAGLWRLPAAVDALAQHPALAVAEMVTLVLAGTGLWLELVTSPPLRPRGSGLQRALIAALAMWFIWAIAYILGFATHGVFHAFRYPPGNGLGAVADQELATGVMWAVAAAYFVPLVFIAAVGWLRDIDNADAELAGAAREGLPAVKGWGHRAPVRGSNGRPRVGR
ncbi:MAG TPA: cytochrome c oxidase assembly protein [Streptosporangiaceae bacterium]|jgi:cytochrome c oxidase assembly factor CtaG|nr:cytochrome c oxidase assembly protein [Streptosporangiaceae bacterium]